MKTREQEYAATIYTQVEGVKGKSYQSDYKNAAKNLPVLIRSAGLVQALYFTQTRNPGSEALIKHLANVIEKPHETLSDYEGICRKRRDERRGIGPFDAREVLYGRALSEFIVHESLAAQDSTDEDLPAQIHAKWLMTSRTDLQGKTPREVLLEKRDLIDFDLHSRELQWSFTGECPPLLPLHSNAYIRSGFGTHEIVVYHEMVRYLISKCLEEKSLLLEEKGLPFENLQAQEVSSSDAEAARLERLKSTWLEKPNRDYSGKTPSHIIEAERRRLPMAVSASEAIIDEDCSLCHRTPEEVQTPMFWHLDGSGMDDSFEFSFYRTRAEWEAEQKRWEEFNREFERDWQQRKEMKLQKESPGRLDKDEDSIQ